MGCSKFREQLSAYLDGELGADETGQTEAHLKACAQCSAELDDLRKAVAHLNSLEPVDPPPWLTQRVMAGIKSEGPKAGAEGFLTRLFSPLYVKVPLGAVATMLLAVTTYFFFQNVVPEMQPRQPEKSAGMPAETPAIKNAPEQTDLPKKKSEAKVPAAADSVADKAQPAEMPQQKAEVQAPHQQEMRVGAGKESLSVAPAAPSGRADEGTARARKAMKYGLAQQHGEIARDESVSGPAPAPSVAKKAVPAAAERESALFHVSAEDIADAGRKVAGELSRFGGKAVKTDSAGDKITVRAELPAARMSEFFEALRKIGSVREKTAPSLTDVSSVVVTVEILPAAQQ